MNEELIKYIIILVGYIALFSVLIMQNKALKNLQSEKENTINIKATKDVKEKLKAYALIKGYKNEAEYISALLEKEILKDKEKLNR